MFLHPQERRRLREKFPAYPSSPLAAEDVRTARRGMETDAAALGRGEICRGNCKPGRLCPRGICNMDRG